MLREPMVMETFEYVPNNEFVEELQSELGLNDAEEALLLELNIRRPEDLVSLTQAFPNLASEGVDLAKLSVAGWGRTDAGFQAMASGISNNATRAATAALGLGAAYPAGAPAPPGFQIPMPKRGKKKSKGVTGGTSQRAAVTGTIDLRPPNWAVRDQGKRGTCVAFATVACHEHFEHQSKGKLPVLSEQYMYWATKRKTGDPFPSTEGTMLCYAKEAIEQIGTCSGSLWRYDKRKRAGDITHASPKRPSRAAHADAVSWKQAVGSCANGGSTGTGNAAALVNALASTSRPVAITLPLVRDPVSRVSNWHTPVGILYGRVLNPPPTSVSYGEGHAVCVTGFVPDATEPNGGYFIIRNSWGPKWASAAPTAGYYSVDKGYGEISATYVEKYLWEMLVF